MTTSSTPTRCPFAESCWMGGGSYACVKTPPFCDGPLIPKVDRRNAAFCSGGASSDERMYNMMNALVQSELTQGELF